MAAQPQAIPQPPQPPQSELCYVAESMLPEGWKARDIVPKALGSRGIFFSAPDVNTSGLLDFFPSCCGIVVVGNLHFNDPKNYDVAFDACERIARNQLYTCVMYTTVPSQVVIIEALTKRGYKPLQSFNSHRTRADITIWSKLLPR